MKPKVQRGATGGRRGRTSAARCLVRATRARAKSEWREARRGPCPARSWRRGATRAQGRRCKARDGPSTDPTAAQRNREASAARAQAWLAQFASEAEHGRRERAQGRHGAASGARLAGPKAHASRVTRAVRRGNREWCARCASLSARRTPIGTERQTARASADGRGPCGAQPKQGP